MLVLFIIAVIFYLMNHPIIVYRADCANFVSQCLSAGGIKMNSSWYSYKGEFNSDTYW